MSKNLSPKKKLTPKQQRFVEEYLIDLNATQAAIRAGYSANDEPPKDNYYTYALICPQLNDVFYIGKGRGRRVFDHERQLKSPMKCNQDKLRRIAAIKLANMELRHLILSEHSSESESYEAESELIASIGIENLTNISLVESRSSRSLSNEWRYLPELQKYDSRSDWASVCLSMLEPFKGEIMFLGQLLSDESQYLLLGLLRGIAREKPATNCLF
jgi:hypothetical protein